MRHDTGSPDVASLSSGMADGGLLSVVGIGPGDYPDLTHRAADTLQRAERIVGYSLYTALVREWLPEAQYIESPIGAESERCGAALDMAAGGLRVALVSSGDAGIYAMAGLVYELAWERGWRFDTPHRPHIEVIAGVTAASAAAALVGAPLMSDFATISLSDLMTPWSVIEQRLRGAALGDFVVALYNPMSRKRHHQLPRACEILLQQHNAATPVAIVRQVCRPEQEARFTTLEQLAREQIDMLTLVIVGNSATRMLGGRMVTLRGYPTDHSGAQ